MSYQVIARKWRSQAFHELVGQTHISVTLLNALKTDHLHHALLFTGPRGTGKTSSARILAKTIRCPNIDRETMNPCQKCDSCIEITLGRSVDVIEIDGASNNGVEAIRELRESVNYMPSSGNKKVYIIDEVHMLSTSAFNALLKTLEEPPSHVLFIMATTEAQKIPVTILSRCQRFDFRRIPTREIADRLKLICDTDKVTYSDDALWLIARQGDGSMRDAQSLLDQAITFSSGALSHQNVASILGLTERSLLLDVLEALIQRKVSAILEIIGRFNVTGIEPFLFIKDLSESLRNLLFSKISEESSGHSSDSSNSTVSSAVSSTVSLTVQLLDLPDSERLFLANLAKVASAEDIHLLFDMALKGSSDIYKSSDPRVVLEVVLIRMASAPRLVQIEKLIEQYREKHETITPVQMSGHEKIEQARELPVIPGPLEKMKSYIEKKSQGSVSSVGSQPTYRPVAQSRPTPVSPNLETTSSPIATDLTLTSEKQETSTLDAEPIAIPQKALRAEDFESETERWVGFVDCIRQTDALFAAKIENLLFISVQNQFISIGVPPKLIFLEKQMEDGQVRKKMQGFIDSFWGPGYSYKVASHLRPDSSVSAQSMVQKKQEKAEEDLRAIVHQDPLVQRAQDVFNVEIAAITPLEQPSVTLK